MTEKELTFGQRRVRMSFNPSPSYEVVDDIKMKTADLIDLCEDFKAKNTSNGEVVRLLSLAQTAFEEAAMWAVKAVTRVNHAG